jgi:hypothetical protein
MDMREFIQNEYEIFCSGKLLFELILTDSFDYLYRNGWLTLYPGQLRGAAATVVDYRRQVLRRHLNQDSVRAASREPVTQEEKRKLENRIRKWHLKQLLVYQWYEKQQANGVRKLFLELPVAV